MLPNWRVLGYFNKLNVLLMPMNKINLLSLQYDILLQFLFSVQQSPESTAQCLLISTIIYKYSLGRTLSALYPMQQIQNQGNPFRERTTSVGDNVNMSVCYKYFNPIYIERVEILTPLLWEIFQYSCFFIWEAPLIRLTKRLFARIVPANNTLS